MQNEVQETLERWYGKGYRDGYEDGLKRGFYVGFFGCAIIWGIVFFVIENEILPRILVH